MEKKAQYRVEQLLEGQVDGRCIVPQQEMFTEMADVRNYLRNFAVIPVQTHSTNDGIVTSRDNQFAETDALVTFERNLPIGIITADCVPILIYAPGVEGVAAVHAGWKGTLGGIVDQTLNVLEGRGADVEQMIVAFGPSISARNYEVDKELAEKFVEAGLSSCVSYPNGPDKKPHIDLQGVNVERLLRRGVKKENIITHQGCTVDSRLNDSTFAYHSYRRSGGGVARQLTCIRLV